VARIDFYVLAGDGDNGRAQLACRLAEKAYQGGHRVYLHAASDDQANQLNELLWTFKQGSFVPHNLHPAPAGDISPVLVGHGEAAGAVEALSAVPGPAAETASSAKPQPGPVLINLSETIPPFFEQFERVIEVVDQNPDTLRACRAKFRDFRDRGFPPQSHKL
jgi:DNA polymerase-3 subunit chi